VSALEAVPPSNEKELSVVGSAVTGSGVLELLQVRVCVHKARCRCGRVYICLSATCVGDPGQS
jgi:hypothetical protein